MVSASRDLSDSSSPRPTSRPSLDPIARTALRYTISAREYELLHQYLISRAPRNVQKRTPNPPGYAKMIRSKTESGDYSSASVRAAFRVFIAVFFGMKGYEALTERLASRKAGGTPGAGSRPAKVRSPHNFPNVRLALSFSAIMLFHRLLHRFFRRLRIALLEDSAEAFRRRNPTVSMTLTSPYTPALGAALSGVLLGLSPSDQLRTTIAIYLFTRSLEFAYNALEDGEHLWWTKEQGRPWWFGSWLIMPLACGQLLDAFVLDRDCFPAAYGPFILTRSPEYIPLRPKNYSKGQPWPATFDIVDALADLSQRKWPAFASPVLFPSGNRDAEDWSPAWSAVRPITGPAHAGITRASCALLHPQDPSCARTYLKYWVRAFPPMARFFALFYGAFALLGSYRKLARGDAAAVASTVLPRLAQRVLRISVFLTGAIGTAWASICLFANFLPRSLLPTQRWFLGGFIAGLWAYVARFGERSTFLYSARTSIDSLYKVGRKRRWWRGLRGGDVWLFVASLALTDLVYEVRPGALRDAYMRKALGVLRGEGWVDRLEMKREAEKGDAPEASSSGTQAPAPSAGKS